MQTYLLQFYSMSARSASTSTPKGTARRPAAVKPLDPHDPDDNAFVLVKKLVFYLCCVFLRKKFLISPFFPSIAFSDPPVTTDLTSSPSP